MTRPETIAGRYATKFIKANPDMPSLTIAKELARRYPDQGKTLNAWQLMVRRRRGQQGDRCRKAMSDRSMMAESGDARRDGGGYVVPHNVRILIYDIETMFMEGSFWRLNKQFLSYAQIVQHSHMICWAAKWLGEDKVRSDSMQHDGDDKRITATLSDMINDADVIVAHNGNRFDLPVIRTRIIKHAIPPLLHVQTYDTCIRARYLFQFPSNRLDDLGDYLGLGRKVQHEGLDLWKKCNEGDPKAWAKMVKYCRGDVKLLEKVYLAMRPHDPRHPNVQVISGQDVLRCRVCGCTALTMTAQPARTSASEFDQYTCDNCGAPMRSRKRHKPVLGTDERVAG